MQFAGPEPARRQRVLEKIAEAAHCGVDYIQLRERDLPARDLERLALTGLQMVREISPPNAAKHTRLLINSRVDVAIASGSDGVHLRSDDMSPTEARGIWRMARNSPQHSPSIAASCHNAHEVEGAARDGTDFAVFAPVFQKQGTDRAAGIEALHSVCRCKIPVLALGGITLENAGSCIAAGAAGIAAIRLFQENRISDVVRRLQQSC